MGSACSKSNNTVPTVVQRPIQNNGISNDQNFSRDDQIVSKHSAQTVPSNAAQMNSNKQGNDSLTNQNTSNSPVSAKKENKQQLQEQKVEYKGLQEKELDDNDEADFMSNLKDKNKKPIDNAALKKDKSENTIVALDFASERGGFINSANQNSPNKDQNKASATDIKTLPRNESKLQERSVKDIISNPDEVDFDPRTSNELGSGPRNEVIKEKENEEDDFDVMDYGHEKKGSIGQQNKPVSNQNQNNYENYSGQSNYNDVNPYKSQEVKETSPINNKAVINNNVQPKEPVAVKSEAPVNKEEPKANEFDDFVEPVEQSPVKVEARNVVATTNNDNAQRNNFRSEESPQFEYDGSSPSKSPDNKLNIKAASPKKKSNTEGIVNEMDEGEIEPFDEDIEY